MNDPSLLNLITIRRNYSQKHCLVVINCAHHEGLLEFIPEERVTFFYPLSTPEDTNLLIRDGEILFHVPGEYCPRDFYPIVRSTLSGYKVPLIFATVEGKLKEKLFWKYHSVVGISTKNHGINRVDRPVAACNGFTSIINTSKYNLHPGQLLIATVPKYEPLKANGTNCPGDNHPTRWPKPTGRMVLETTPIEKAELTFDLTTLIPLLALWTKHLKLTNGAGITEASAQAITDLTEEKKFVRNQLNIFCNPDPTDPNYREPTDEEQRKYSIALFEGMQILTGKTIFKSMAPFSNRFIGTTVGFARPGEPIAASLNIEGQPFIQYEQIFHPKNPSPFQDEEGVIPPDDDDDDL